MMKTFLAITAIIVCVHGDPAAISNTQSDKIFDELNEIGEKLDEIRVVVQDAKYCAVYYDCSMKGMRDCQTDAAKSSDGSCHIRNNCQLSKQDYCGPINDQNDAHNFIKAPESDEVTKHSTCEDGKGEEYCKKWLKYHASKCTSAEPKWKDMIARWCYKSCGLCTGGSDVKEKSICVSLNVRCRSGYHCLPTDGQSYKCIKNSAKKLSDPAASCIDKNQNCGSWAAIGKCKKNPGHMLANCCKSCKNQKDAHNFIKAPESDKVTKHSTCEDGKGEEYCKKWLKYHASKCTSAEPKWKDMIARWCYKSCGLCTGGSNDKEI